MNNILTNPAIARSDLPRRAQRTQGSFKIRYVGAKPDRTVSIASTCHAGHGRANGFLPLASLNREIWQSVVKYVYGIRSRSAAAEGTLKRCRWMHL
jgi:hypothetical protein